MGEGSGAITLYRDTQNDAPDKPCPVVHQLATELVDRDRELRHAYGLGWPVRHASTTRAADLS